MRTEKQIRNAIQQLEVEISQSGDKIEIAILAAAGNTLRWVEGDMMAFKNPLGHCRAAAKYLQGYFGRKIAEDRKSRKK